MPRQKETISAINLAQFIAEKTDKNLFLTGKAGTGKTVFLKEFKEHTKKKVVVLAPTGIAAINAHEFVSEDIINKVRQFKTDNPESEGLKPIFDSFDGNVSYNEIRFALMCL